MKRSKSVLLVREGEGRRAHTYWRTRLVRRQRTRQAVLIVVGPRAEIFRVRTLDVLAVAVGSKSIPCLGRVVVKDPGVGEVVRNDCASGAKSEAKRAEKLYQTSLTTPDPITTPFYAYLD